MTRWIPSSSQKILDGIVGLARIEIIDIGAATPKLPEDLQDFVKRTDKQKGDLEAILKKIIGFWKDQNISETNHQNKWRQEPTDVAQHTHDRARNSGKIPKQSENEELGKIDNALEESKSISDARWQAREADFKRQISNLQSKNADLRKIQNGLKEDKSISDAWWQTREMELKMQITAMQNESRAEKERLNTAHQVELRRLRDEHQKSTNQLNTAHQAELRRLRDEHQKSTNQLKATHQSGMQDLRDGHQTSMNLLKANYERERESNLQQQKEISRRHKSEIQQHQIRMTQMRTDSDLKREEIIKGFQADKLLLTSQMARDKAHMKKEFQGKEAQMMAEKERLQKDINAYTTELMRQDNFKAAPDIEIKSKFQAIAQDIEALARMEWRPDQTKWPVPRLQQLSANQRLLKMQILQDMLWSMLDEFIFSTPFRVFGEEGQSLAKQWYEACAKSKDLSTEGQAYTWPPPKMETERWRYVTIKECSAALRQPVPSEWDPRAKLKKGFKTTLDTLNSELTKRLGEVALIEDGHTQAIESLARTAAVTWLEFGAQRCRLMVVLKDTNLTSKNTNQMERQRTDAFSLVIVPALKRFGNSKGEKLDEVEETIRGCDAEIAKYGR